MAIIASATDDRVEVVTSDKGQKGDTGTAGLDGAGFDAVRESLLDSPLCRLFTPNKLVDTLAGSLTWTRASTATYIDRYGVVKTATIDEPREESDGWLIEGASTNLLTYSEDFSQTSWIATRVTKTSNSVVAPDVSTGAYTLTEDTDTGIHGIFPIINVNAGETVTASFYVKANSITQCSILFGGTGDTSQPYFDLTSGTVLVNQGNAKIKPLSNGWYRVSASNTPTVTGTGTVSILLAKNGNSIYTGDNSSSLYVWAAQLEALPFASSYIPTTAAPATRAADEIEIEQLNNVISSAESAWSIFFRGNRFGVRVMQITEGATDNSSTTDYSLFYGISDDVFVRDCSSSGVGLSSTGGFVENSWFSYTSAIYGASKTIYGAGGTSAATITPTTSINESSTMRIGSAKNGNYPVYGHIRDFRIYDFELNADEVALLSGVK